MATLTTARERVCRLLESAGVPFEQIHHREDFSAQLTAAHTHTPGGSFAKVVVVNVDGAFAMAVIPAHHRVVTESLARVLGARSVRLATEDEMRRLFPDCEVGAEPPVSALYGLPVYVSRGLDRDGAVTFNAGSHEDAIRVGYDDFVRIARAQPGDFSAPIHHHAG